jgi:8-hydroxy-5-deazaflavin:NADPH oxidoreductase
VKARIIAVVLVVLGATGVVQARTVAIIGTGGVGSALGIRWAASGHEIVYGSRSPGSERVVALVAETGHGARAVSPVEAVAAADVVVLAVPYGVVERILPTLGDAAGKVVIDCTNPLSRDLHSLVTGPDASGAEIIAGLLPGAKVVKALNTTGVSNMRDAVYPDGPPTMLLAGESSLAKAVVSELVVDLGFEPVDAGSLKSARWLEPLAMLWIELAYRQGMGDDIAFKLIRR